MKRNRITLFAGRQTTRHYLECFKILEQSYGWQIHLITMYSEIADEARRYLQVDKVFLVNRFEIPFFHDGLTLREVVELARPDCWMIVGDVESPYKSHLRNTKLPCIWLHTTSDTSSSQNIPVQRKNLKEILPDITSHLSPNISTVHVPEPMIRYTDFLDLDTNQVLQWKTDYELVRYEENSIQKKYLVGVLGATAQEHIVEQLISSQDMVMYSIVGSKLSHIPLPEVTEENAPIVFELCDAIIITDPEDPQVIITLMRAMASGTIIIAPRTEFFINLLGKGALYYKQDSVTELQACLEILARSEQKRQEIRQAASIMFDKRFSYSAITRMWNTVIDSTLH